MLNNSSRLTFYVGGSEKRMAGYSPKCVLSTWSGVLPVLERKWRKFLHPSIFPEFNFSRNFTTLRDISRVSVQGLKIVGFGATIFVANYTSVAYQDMQSLKTGERWLVHLPQAPGKSIASASLGFLDPTITGSIENLPRNALRSEDVDRLVGDIPKAHQPSKINRKLKGDRVVLSTIKRPPAHFSAGSVLRRQSLLSPLGLDKNQSLAFVKPRPADEAFKIASVFHNTQDRQKQKIAKLPVLVASLVRESQSSTLAYSSEDKLKYSPFAAVLRDENPISIIPKLDNKDHSWADDPLPKASFSKQQQKCLATGIYFEARGESVRGQAAVAQVILNRVRNPSYPNSICGVVYQNKTRTNRCQFSFACDKIRDRVNNKRLWALAQNVAQETTAGRIWLSKVGSSTHYHANYVRPKWARRMKKLGKIGLHIFYRTKRGGWS